MSYNVDGPCETCGGLVMADAQRLADVPEAFKRELDKHRATECKGAQPAAPPAPTPGKPKEGPWCADFIGWANKLWRG